jgi:hypothetical protein
MLSASSSVETFDRFSRLQILVGHMGEALPFMLPRLDTMNASVTKLNRPISAYLRENVYYTFSGFNYTPTFLNLLPRWCRMNKNCNTELVAKKHCGGQDEDQKQNLHFAPSLLEMPKLVNGL